MKKRKGFNKRKAHKIGKGHDAMYRQIERAASRRTPDDKPSKGMKRFGKKAAAAKGGE